MALNGLSRFGLLLLALGWALLLFGRPAASLYRARIGGSLMEGSDLSVIAQMAILTGLGVALLGVLRSGFGALHRFFEAMAQGMASEKGPASEKEAVENGWIRDREYVLFSDGTVEVETLLGPRRFASLEEAQDFIRV